VTPTFIHLEPESGAELGARAPASDFGQIVPFILMIAGTIVAASVGRVLYQIALASPAMTMASSRCSFC
jgi:hypothetical protein